MTVPAVAHRIACRDCGAERLIMHAESTCPVCGCEYAKTVAPSAGDQAAIERDVITAAEAVDAELLRAGVVHRSSNSARHLATACRELALVRAGVCPR